MAQTQGGGIPASEQGFVYLLRMAHDDLKKVYIKIGRAADVERRLNDLQTGNPFKLNLWLTFFVRNMAQGEILLKVSCKVFCSGCRTEEGRSGLLGTTNVLRLRASNKPLQTHCRVQEK